MNTHPKIRSPLLLVLACATVAACGGGGGGSSSGAGSSGSAGAGVLGRATLLADANSGRLERSSSPRNLTRRGRSVYFRAATPEHGNELWVTDGTGNGTRLVKDIQPGEGSSYPSSFADHDGLLYFLARDGATGHELWVTDGTEQGTRRAAETVPGPDGELDDVASVGSWLALVSEDAADRPTLWRFDASGLAPVTEVDPVDPLLDLDDLTAAGGLVFFVAETLAEGEELWVSDGTAAGTQVLDLYPGPQSSDPRDLVVWNGLLYFTASDATGKDLWESDGTLSGTRRIDIRPGGGADPGELTLAPFGLVFGARGDPLEGHELYCYDGTAHLVKDLRPGGSSNPDRFVAGRDLVVFLAFDDQSLGIYVSDGTGAGTVRLMDFPSGGNYSGRGVGVQDEVLFVLGEPLTGEELWITDGTPSGTRLLADLLPGPEGSRPVEFVNVGGRALFSAASSSGRELFAFEPDSGQVAQVKNIAPDRGDSDPGRFASTSQGLLYCAFTKELGHELWRLSPRGLEVPVDLAPGKEDSDPEQFLDLGGPVFFTAEDPAHGHELWSLRDGILQVLDLEPGPEDSDPLFLTPLGDGFLFSAATRSDGRELWQSDGTPGGTTLLKDIVPGSGGSFVFWILRAGAFAYFTAFLGSESELWRTDGTAAGTVMVVDIDPGTSADPFPLAAIGDLLLFNARDPVHDYQLWSSDGTTTGTLRLTDSLTTPVLAAAATRDRLFFAAADAARGIELWTSDGTREGTRRVGDLFAGPASALELISEGSVGFTLGATESRAFFAANDGVHGTELWVSDGTRKGTRLVVDLVPGPESSLPRRFAAIPGHDRVVFSAFTPGRGVEVWESDGTAAGTHRVTDLAPGPRHSNPRDFTAHEDRIYFTADDGTYGREVWSVPVRARR